MNKRHHLGNKRHVAEVVVPQGGPGEREQMRLRGLGKSPERRETHRGVSPGPKQFGGSRVTLRDSCGKETKHLPVSELTLVQSLSFTLKLHVFGNTEALLIGETDQS